MKNKFFFLAFALILVVVATGCKSATQRTAEKVMEKSIEAQTNGQVDVDANGNEVTIKTEDGQIQYSAGGDVKIPDDFPKELIISNDAKVIISSSTEGGSTVAYVTNDEQGAIFDKYLSDLPDQGWKKEMELDTASGKMATFSKDKENVSITVGENNSDDKSGKTLVHVVLVKNSD